MPSWPRWSVALVSCLMLTGCGANDLMVKRQSEAEAKIEHLIQADKKGEQRLNELAAQLQVQEDQVRDAAAQLKQMLAGIQELRIVQEELKGRLVLLGQQGQQATTPKIAVVNQETTPKGKDAGPPPEYVKAFGLYSANNFPAAIEAFEAFLKVKPQSDYAANAVYWIGECHYSLSELPQARATFQKVVGSYPKSAKVPDALLKLGYTLAAMKEKAKAGAVFEELIKAYPGNPAAAKARERLTAN